MVVLCAGLSDAGKRLGSGQSAAPGEPVRGPETPLGRSEHMGIRWPVVWGRYVRESVASGRAVSAGHLGLAGVGGGPRIAGHERHSQRSGRVVRASAGCPAASTSIQVVAWL